MKLLDGPLQCVATGFGFTEGPCWIAGQGVLLFTDVPGNAIHALGPGGVSLWQANSHFAIGLACDRAGRVLACEHSTRSLTATQLRADGSAGGREVLAASVAGRVLNSTNDVICARDGTILFTDPPFGVRAEDGALHGYQQAMELAGAYVFRVGDSIDAPVPVVTGIYRPNGLCLSPDEGSLYISDSSDRHHKVLVMEVGPGWTLSEPRDFAVMPVGVPDGMRVDEAGNLWVAGGDGVYIWSPTGAQIGHLPVPEMVTNLTFGGSDGRDVYITAVTSVYRMRAGLPGALCT